MSGEGRTNDTVATGIIPAASIAASSLVPLGIIRALETLEPLALSPDAVGGAA